MLVWLAWILAVHGSSDEDIFGHHSSFFDLLNSGVTFEMLVPFTLKAHEETQFFEEFSTGGDILLGGFFSSDAVDVTWRDQQSQIRYHKVSQDETFDIPLTPQSPGTPETLALSIMNRHPFDVYLTVALTRGPPSLLDSYQAKASRRDVYEIHDDVEDIENILSTVSNEVSLRWGTKQIHLETAILMQNRLYWTCLIQALLVLGVSFFQWRHLGSLLKRPSRI